MVKYKIIASEDNLTATAYIEVKRHLLGEEPVIKQRFEALAELLQPDTDYEKAWKSALTEKLIAQKVGK